MALPAFLKRNAAAAAAPVPDDATIVLQARARARRRLIGAAVLLAIGVVSFPLLFETQPRPIPVDIPIEIPRKDGLPPLAAPAKPARVVTGQVSGTPAVRDLTEPAAAVPAASTPAPVKTAAAPTVALPSAAQTAPVPTPASAPAPAPVPAVAAAADRKPPATAASASAPRESSATRPAAAASTAADGGRFVVQVGAFADVTAAREVRLKVEKLGLKTYTQVVETPQGKRIRVRVGPFGTQEDAGKVLARLKAAQLPGAVLTL